MINRNNMYDLFHYHDVTDPDVLSKLPPTFTRVPILIVKGCKIPLIGKEVFTWVQSQQYLNLSSTNITTSRNPEFKVDPSLGVSKDYKGAALRDEDDDKLISSLAHSDNWNLHISKGINTRFIDSKIDISKQKEQLEKLERERNNDLQRIMDAHKSF